MELSFIYSGWLIEWCLSLVLCLVLLRSTIINFKHTSILLSHKLASIVYYISYTLSFLFLVADFGLKTVPVTAGRFDEIEDICWAIGIFFGGFASLVYTLLLLIRDHTTFIDSIYKSPPSLYYAFCVAMVIAFLSGACYTVLVLNGVLNATQLDAVLNGVLNTTQLDTVLNTTQLDAVLRVVFLGVLAIIIIVIRFVLIAVFIHKLRKVIAKHHSMNSKVHSISKSVQWHPQISASTSSSMSDEDEDMIEDGHPILRAITKQTLLGSVAMAVNTVALLLVGVERLTRDKDVEDFAYVAIAFLGVSFWVEMLCVYLGFSFNEQRYSAVCEVCHDKCSREVTVKKVRRMSLQISQQQLELGKGIPHSMKARQDDKHALAKFIDSEKNEADLDALWHAFDKDNSGHIDDLELQEIVYHIIVIFWEYATPQKKQPKRDQLQSVIDHICSNIYVKVGVDSVEQAMARASSLRGGVQANNKEITRKDFRPFGEYVQEQWAACVHKVRKKDKTKSDLCSSQHSFKLNFGTVTNTVRSISPSITNGK